LPLALGLGEGIAEGVAEGANDEDGVGLMTGVDWAFVG